MGIGSDVIELMIHLRMSGLIGLTATVAEIGAQQLDRSFLEATERRERLGTLFGIDHGLPLPSAPATHFAHGSLSHLNADAPWAREFWTWLGFEYAAIDIDGSPGSIPLDLNYDNVPAAARGHYTLVTNFGTTEHVANQLNAFKIIHELTAIGGLMIHHLPAQGFYNHGLVNYNFKFFWMLARSNNYKFIHASYNQNPPYNIPENIVAFITSTSCTPQADLSCYQGADGGFCVVMQKTLDIPFVAPLDVPTGTQTESEELKNRYWTVFDPDKLERLLQDSTGQKKL